MRKLILVPAFIAASIATSMLARAAALVLAARYGVTR